jgi:hypothetical protein
MPEMDVPFIVSLIRETYRIENKYQAERPVTIAFAPKHDKRDVLCTMLLMHGIRII